MMDRKLTQSGGGGEQERRCACMYISDKGKRGRKETKLFFFSTCLCTCGTRRSGNQQKRHVEIIR